MTFFLLIVIGTFIAYLPGISHSVFGGDSGDIILAAYYAGVAHPPGYPLNSLIGWVFAHLPYDATIAYKVDLMQAVFMSASIGFLFLTLRILTRNVFVSLAAALTLAFNPLFWLYAHVAEVFQLGILLVSASSWLLFKWWEEKKSEVRRSKKQSIKYLYWSIFFLGFAIFHHHTFVLLVPPYLYFVYKNESAIFKNGKGYLKLIAIFLVGFLPYLVLPVLASGNPPANWDNPVNLQNFIRLITRADYGSFTIAPSFLGVTIQSRLLQIVSFTAFLKSDFTIIGFLIMAVGAVHTFFKKRIIFWFLALAVILTGPTFLAYSSFDLSNDFFFGIWERFILVTYYFLTFFLAFGLLSMLSFLRDRLSQIKIRSENVSLLGLVFQSIFLLLPFSFFFLNYPKADLSRFNLGDYLAYDTLSSSERNSIIFMFDDTTTLNTKYIYYTTDDYKDRKLIISGFLNYKYYREQLTREYPQLVFPADFNKESEDTDFEYIDAIIDQNHEKFPIYSVSSKLKVEQGGWAPRGLLYKYFMSPPPQVSDNEVESIFSKFKLQDNPDEYTHFIANHIKNLYYSAYINASIMLADGNHFEDANRYAYKAIKLDPERNLAYLELGKQYRRNSQCDKAKDVLFKALVLDKVYVPTLGELVIYSRECENNEQAAKSYEDQIDRITHSFEKKFN